MPKTIVIVGNGKPERNVSTEIDAADTVVRFSTMDHYSTKQLGLRTDIVVLRARWLYAYKRPACPHLPHAIKNGARLWIINHGPYGYPAVTLHESYIATMNIVAPTPTTLTIWERRQIKETDKVWPILYNNRLLRGVPYEVIGDYTRLALRAWIVRYSASLPADLLCSARHPTAGLFTTAFVLAAERYRGWIVKLAGFPMKFAGHTLAWEKATLSHWREEGCIQLL